MVSEQSEPIAPVHTETHSAETPLLSSNETPVPPTAPAARFMDDSNPFLLSNGDNPSLSLVTQVLTGENYQTWSRPMTMALIAKNKVGFVNGIIQPMEPSSPQYSSWKRCDTMVLSWIINSLSKEISASVIYLDTAFEVWQDLKERFTQSNGPRVYQLQKAIASLSQDQCSVSTFYTKLKALWDELINFRPIPALLRGQILLMEPLPSINKVFALVSQEERQRELNSRPILHAVESGSTAFAVTNYKPYGGNKNFGKKERPVCSHCGITGHTVEKCYKIHGYPPGYKPRGRAAANQVTAPSMGNQGSAPLSITSEQCQQLLSFLNSQMSNEASTSNHQAATVMANSSNFSGILHHSQILHSPKHTVFSTKIVNRNAYSNGTWVIDTGATDHMVYSTKLFTKITSTIHTTVELPNGESALVTHIGTVKISESLILADVLCVPSFSFNLISVSKLTSSLNCCIFFLSNLCFIQDLVKWKLIGRGKEKEGLYLLEAPRFYVCS
uniref:Retrotransposon Copia-like N-terminal domain-containing protein n=1 Tax=Fagus sylvatica TaxID=28930 RepID=A0A2N9GXX7_FAGSY